MVVLPTHELAHAFVAVKSGDNSPKIYNRYTFNPLAHTDLLGLLCFTFIGFGWSKPMPINPYNFKHPKRDGFFVSIAGALGTILLAFIVYPLFYASLFIPQFGYFSLVLQTTLSYIVSLSLVYAVFNLIPVYPLDGFMAIDALSKKRGKVYNFLQTKGVYVLYFLFALSIFADLTNMYQLDILGNAISYAAYYLGLPIYAFWGLIL